MKIEVLGTVQDGGVPHLGCSCDLCEAAREDVNEARFVNSLMVEENGQKDSIRYIIGAGPDLRFQFHGKYFDGIFPIDNHFSHMTGLLYMGEFALEMSDLPVYTVDFMQDYLMQNDPYRLLIDRGNINLQDIEPGEKTGLHNLQITPYVRFHREDTKGTLAFLIEGEEKTIYYASIIYQDWSEEDLELIEEADIAILDGCFWYAEEVERYSEEPPHPLIPDTMELTEDFDTDIYFTHMNHTNPVLREDSEERQELEERGFHAVERGMQFEI